MFSFTPLPPFSLSWSLEEKGGVARGGGAWGRGWVVSNKILAGPSYNVTPNKLLNRFLHYYSFPPPTLLLSVHSVLSMTAGLWHSLQQWPPSPLHSVKCAAQRQVCCTASSLLHSVKSAAQRQVCCKASSLLHSVKSATRLQVRFLVSSPLLVFKPASQPQARFLCFSVAILLLGFKSASQL